MLGEASVELLVQLRVDLLQYWKDQKDLNIKEELSDRLNKLDDLIARQRSLLEERKRKLGV